MYFYKNIFSSKSCSATVNSNIYNCCFKFGIARYRSICKTAVNNSMKCTNEGIEKIKKWTAVYRCKSTTLSRISIWNKLQYQCNIMSGKYRLLCAFHNKNFCAVTVVSGRQIEFGPLKAQVVWVAYHRMHAISAPPNMLYRSADRIYYDVLCLIDYVDSKQNYSNINYGY